MSLKKSFDAYAKNKKKEKEEFQPSEFAVQLFFAISKRSSRRLDNLGISPSTQLRPLDLDWLAKMIADNEYRNEP